MKKIGIGIAFLVLLFVIPAVAQETDVIQTPPVFAIGDTWVYDGGFDSLDDAKAGKNPTSWDIIRIIREINDKGILVSNPKGNRQFLYDKEFNLLERHVDGQSTFYKPFWPRYRYPMKVGDKYNVGFSHNRPDGFDNDYNATVRVIGWEAVTVPAGTFKALKVEMTGYWTHSLGIAAGTGRADFREISWFAPELKMRHVLYLWEASWGMGSSSYYESLKSYSLK
jgi:hypothetical protein